MSASSTELATRPITPMDMLQMAVSQKADLAYVKQLMDLHERWELNKAKVEFREAMAEFKRNPPDIVKKHVAEIKARESQKVVGSYNFADLNDYSEPISAGLAAVGITHRFRHPQLPDGRISVICILSKGIYSEEGEPLTSAPDTSGAKNAIQSIGSTLSYLERYTLCAATGMSAGMPDNDGNSGQPPVGVPSDVIAEKCEWMANAKDLEELKKLYMAAIALAEKVNDKNATQKFIAAKNLRYKELA